MSVEEIKQKYSEYLGRWQVFEYENFIRIALVSIKPEHRGQGIGRQVFEELITYADHVGKVVTLNPSGDFGANKAELINFYRDLGFVLNQGRSKNYEISELMYREPNPNLGENVMKKDRLQELAGILKEDKNKENFLGQAFKSLFDTKAALLQFFGENKESLGKEGKLKVRALVEQIEGMFSELTDLKLYESVKDKTKNVIKEQLDSDKYEVVKKLVSKHKLRNAVLAAPEGDPKSSSDVDALEYAMNKIAEALADAYEQGREDVVHEEY